MPVCLQPLGPQLFRLGGVLVLVAVITAIDSFLLHVNSATAPFPYLLLVLALATRIGLTEAITASIASVLCYNFFFLPPVGTLTIADPQNWLALTVFLITAVTASQLSDRARRRAEEASAHRREMERVYDFSRALMLTGSERSVASQIAQQVAEIFGIPTVAFHELSLQSTYRVGADAAPLTEVRLREAARTGARWQDTEMGAAIVPLSLGGRGLGSLGIAGAPLSPVALPAIAQLAAIAIERARAQEAASRAEVTRQNEQLKSTLLDALAHEFKTPLTSIKAAVSSVLATVPTDPVEHELLTVIDEEVDRLTSLVTESLEVARIGAGNVHLHREPYPAPLLVSDALAHLRPFCDGRTITVRLAPNLPRLDIDVKLCGLLLRQLLANALKYAPPAATIEVEAKHESEFAVLHVCNEGPPIPAPEQEAIFEKFYRGQAARDQVPGTGLGLTIAREIVQAHGGRIWVDSAPGQGVCFSFTLPLTHAERESPVPATAATP